MKDTCAVSILVPICNVENYLRECLESLIYQTLDDIQIICIDDGSSDSSPLIIEEFMRLDSRVEVITKPNSGYGDSMNKGLAKARGEYVGIVESDDFASFDMFETLYRYAKALDLDMVKENFFQHTTGPDGGDEYFDNIPGGPFGRVLARDDDGRRTAMLMKPAIWSGLYRRSFLEEKNIRFLPTPGASFQDTSFHFKAISLAERLAFFPTAHLHYRIDNVNSSVASKSKAYFICEEYAAIWESVKSHADTPEFVRNLVPCIQFGGYAWNTDRLSPELQGAFYQRFLSEYQQMQAEGLLHEDAFDAPVWADMAQMLADPDGYFVRRFGPLKVNTTCVLTVNEATAPKLENATKAIHKLLGDSCEIIVDCPDALRPDVSARIAEIRLQDSCVFDADPSFESRIAKSVPIARLRGSKTIALNWVNPKDNVGNLLYAARANAGQVQTVKNGSAALQMDTSQLQQLELPILLPLLATTFYTDLANPANQAQRSTAAPAPQAAFGTLAGPQLLKDYRKAQDLLGNLASALEGCSFGFASYAHQLLAPAWRRIRDAYDEAPYIQRDDWGAKPSASTLPCCMPAKGQPGSPLNQSEPVNLTVIIPVYNSQDTIASCLESVLCQTETSLQVICVDDGSVDASAYVVNELAKVDPRVQLISAFNGGAGCARNRALPFTRGEYLAFIDSDDVYPSNDVLKSLYAAAKEHDARICGGTFAVLGEDGELQHPFNHEYRAYIVREEGFRTFAQDQFDYGWIRYIYHRSLFDEGIRFPELAHYEDPVFLADVMEKCPDYYVLPMDAYCYCESGGKRIYNKKQVRDLLRGIKHNLEFAERCGYPSLYALLITRLNLEYCEGIVENSQDDEVYALLMELQESVRSSDFAKKRLVNREALMLEPCKQVRFPQAEPVADRLMRRLLNR